MADPGFPMGGANSQVWGKNVLFGKVFAENCMKMKEIGQGAHIPGTPALDPPMQVVGIRLTCHLVSLIFVTALVLRTVCEKIYCHFQLYQRGFLALISLTALLKSLEEVSFIFLTRCPIFLTINLKSMLNLKTNLFIFKKETCTYCKKKSLKEKKLHTCKQRVLCCSDIVPFKLLRLVTI